MTCQKCQGLIGLVLDPLIQQNRLIKVHAKHATLHAA